MFDQIVKASIGVAIVAVLAGAFLGREQTANSSPTHVPAEHGAGLLSQWLGGAGLRPNSAPTAVAPAAGSPTGPGYGEVDIPPDPAGHYHANVEIEGRTVPMLVDTGATRVSLTFADAERLAIAPAPSDYTITVQTANGTAKAAPITLREVRVGTLEVRDVPALVMPKDIVGTSLLGMTFLQKLGGFQIVAGNLVLRH